MGVGEVMDATFDPDEEQLLADIESGKHPAIHDGAGMRHADGPDVRYEFDSNSQQLKLVDSVSGEVLCDGPCDGERYLADEKYREDMRQELLAQLTLQAWEPARSGEDEESHDS